MQKEGFCAAIIMWVDLPTRGHHTVVKLTEGCPSPVCAGPWCSSPLRHTRPLGAPEAWKGR